VLANGEREASHRSNYQETYKKQASNSPNQIELNDRALKRLLNSSRNILLYQPIELGKQKQKNTKAAPRAISEGRVLFRAQTGKVNSAAAAAVLVTTTTVVVGGKQTKKNRRSGNGR
jgi:hypothetical protein